MKQALSKLGFIGWGIRGFGILGLLAYPTLGAAFAAPRLDRAALIRYLIFAGLHVLFAAHIYLLNDWGDALLNPDEPRQRKYQAMKRPELVGEREIIFLTWTLLALALIGFFFLSRQLCLIGLIAGAVTVLYSHPRIHWKGVPVLSTICHFSFAWLYFLAGWTLFGSLSVRAAAVGLFLALVLSAGHFSNEIEDFQSDSQAGIRTNAIAFGPRRVFSLGLALFQLSSLYLMGLALAGMVNPGLGWIGAALALIWIIQIVRYRRWQSGDPIHAFRDSYRMVYALVSLAMLVLVLWEKS